VAGFALERQHILAEVIGQLDDGEWRARGHHPMIVARVVLQRPSSAKTLPTLYIGLAADALPDAEHRSARISGR
jgi:hypothetical protein